MSWVGGDRSPARKASTGRCRLPLALHRGPRAKLNDLAFLSADIGSGDGPLANLSGYDLREFPRDSAMPARKFGRNLAIWCPRQANCRLGSLTPVDRELIWERIIELAITDAQELCAPVLTHAGKELREPPMG